MSQSSYINARENLGELEKVLETQGCNTVKLQHPAFFVLQSSIRVSI